MEVGGSWKDEEQEGRSRQTRDERRNVDECIAQRNPSPSVTNVKSDREARFNREKRETPSSLLITYRCAMIYETPCMRLQMPEHVATQQQPRL